MNFTREVSSSGDQFKRLSRAALLAHDEQYKSLAPELPEWCNPCSSRSLADDDAGDRGVAGSVG